MVIHFKFKEICKNVIKRFQLSHINLKLIKVNCAKMKGKINRI